MAASKSSNGANRNLPAFLNQTKSALREKFVDLEWNQRRRLIQGPQTNEKNGQKAAEFARLQGQHITSRNRYNNVEPFALNRIKLQVTDGKNDYINASPIRLGNRRYIATQGPIGTSVNHFYRMIAAEVKEPAVVIMLTQTHESGKEKCFQYYPKTNDPTLTIPGDTSFGDDFEGKVTLQSEEMDENTRSEIRDMRLETTHHTQTCSKRVIHLLFSGWPDFLVPEGDNRGALVALVQLSAGINSGMSIAEANRRQHHTIVTDQINHDQSNPRIIHCSAGVGRSGTFIALDYLLSQMHSGELDKLGPDDDPIYDTVDKLRAQRMMMVQGESQFLFLYDILRELMLSRANAAAK